MAGKVNDRSAAVEAMAVEWPMLEALMGGVRKMREGGKRWLPQWPNEDDDAYKTRVSTATLFPAYRRTVGVMVGKPFSAELTLSEATPVEIRGEYGEDGQQEKPGWADDIDREGVSLHVFASEMFEESFYGLCGILVDTPKPIPTAGPQPTKREQDQAGVRPYFVRVMHNQILGWKSALREGGGGRYLTQLRILECVTEDDGEFAEREIEQVRVLTPGAWQVWREGPRSEWVLHDEGTTSLDFIPFVPVYGRRRGFMDGAPPLLDLAYLNVEHWQSKSDQQTILHVARVPILFGKGIGAQTSLSVGSASAILVDETNADLKWVEHTGAAIDSGAKSLEALEEEMIQSGAELLVKRPGTRTATEDANDAEGNKSDLLRMVENFEDSINQALVIMAQMAKLEASGSATAHKDFGASSLSGASATLIKDLMVANKLSDETGINELKRRGELSAEVDPEIEAERIKAQGPPLGEVMNDPLANPRKAPGAL